MVQEKQPREGQMREGQMQVGQVHERRTFLGMQAVIASRPMRALLETAERVARSNASVLILGESGSGKELVARAIHHYSPRAAGPWVDLNCAALPEHLMESELFGHERGAFSGADASKPGLFEMAHNGTIFLDEIGDLEPRMQVKLLRVLDGMPYYRLGGIRKVIVDVRVVAATNQDLVRAVEQGRFRSDLYHRLNQFTLLVPPLRERVEDIVPLARHFLAQHVLDEHCLEEERKRFFFSQSAIALMEAQAWPGNIRQLRNAVISAVIWATGEQIDSVPMEAPGLESQGLEIMRSETVTPNTVNHNDTIVGETGAYETGAALETGALEKIEKQVILHMLAQTGGHQQKAAARLGISRRTLHRKLKQYRPENADLAVSGKVSIAL